MDRWMDRWMDRRMDGQTDGQTDRQTEDLMSTWATTDRKKFHFCCYKVSPPAPWFAPNVGDISFRKTLGWVGFIPTNSWSLEEWMYSIWHLTEKRTGLSVRPSAFLFVLPRLSVHLSNNNGSKKINYPPSLFLSTVPNNYRTRHLKNLSKLPVEDWFENAV